LHYNNRKKKFNTSFLLLGADTATAAFLLRSPVFMLQHALLARPAAAARLTALFLACRTLALFFPAPAARQLKQQKLPRADTVLVLGAELLAPDHDPRRDMFQDNTGSDLVDILPAGARGTDEQFFYICGLHLRYLAFP
jgi:hypothetical protein